MRTDRNAHIYIFLKMIENATNGLAGHTDNITCRVYARIGLLGNPSDAFGGKVIAASINNFFSEVTCSSSEGGIIFVPHELHDPGSFDDLAALDQHITSKGYSGGVRLLQVFLRLD